jgi:uracil-DNA glycosylase
MQGFFPHKQIESKTVKPTGKVLSCQTCGLGNEQFAPVGNFEKEILIISERPNDSLGLLRKTLEKYDVNLQTDCLTISAIECHSQHLPTPLQTDCCRKNVLKTIEERKPKLIILLGQAALYSVIGHRWKKDLGTIPKWRGFCIPDQDLQCWVCPTYSPIWAANTKPAYNNNDKIETLIWEQDIQQALKCLEQSFPKHIEPKIDIIESLEPLTKLSQMGNISIAFDYETTGLKPHAEGHRIVCASVAYSPGHVYVFMLPEKRKDLRPFIELLKNPNIGKIAHNMKFEETWSVVRLDTPITNWQWDSMQAAHILDNRQGVSGLKFQVYINFGIIDYSSEISPYLEGDPKDANSFNRVLELIKQPGGKEKLMKYCAYDSIYEYRLAMKQQEIMGYEKNKFNI